MEKRLMVLGAGGGQLPMIQRARELGCYVITVDYLPANIGHKLAHESVDCSTVDREAVLAVARRLQIDGIATFASDVATATVGYVAGALGLPGCSLTVAETMSNKALFRDFQHRHGGVESPGFVTGTRWEEMADAVRGLRWPVMFKPVDTSGSRGVNRVEHFDEATCAAAFAFAQQFARSQVVCAEEYVTGEDVSGDGFLVGGNVHAVITRKYKAGYVPTGHSLPTHLSAADQARVLAEVTANCVAVGYADGPIDFDVRVSPARTTVLEMSPRLGGNGIPMLVGRSTGFDLVEANIRFALGERVAPPAELAVCQGSGSLVFGSQRAGTLQHIAGLEEVQRQVPELFSYVTNCVAGDEVADFTHGGTSLGYALFDCPAAAAYPELVARLSRAIDLVVV